MTIDQLPRADVATGTTVMFGTRLKGGRPEEMERRSHAEAARCFGSDATLSTAVSDVNPPGLFSLFEIAVVVGNTSLRVDGRLGEARMFRVTGNSMRSLERAALGEAREWFGRDSVLRVVSSRVKKWHGEDNRDNPFVGEFEIAEFQRAEAGTRTCVLTLEDLITGGDIEQMERRAWQEGRLFFGPDAELTVRFRDVCTTPERLNTRDPFFSMFVDVEAVLSGPPQFDEQPCTSFPVGSVTGNDMRQMERRAIHPARQFFGPDAEYRVVFEDGVQSRPHYIKSKDRFYARSVVVEVILSEPAQAGEPELTFWGEFRGKNRRELERAALRAARRRLQGRLATGTELRVEFGDGHFGASRESVHDEATYYAWIVEVYTSGDAA
ncbi:hypothetical protein ACQEU6_26200 [Spirillospora sp. CA-108201]